MRVTALAVVLLGVCSNAYACEPIIPMAMAVGGPHLVLHSGLALLAAILLKCVLFGAFQRGISFVLAFGMMFLGNIVSTIVGIFPAAMVGTPALFLILLPIVFALCWLPARRLTIVVPRLKLGPVGAATVMVVSLYVSTILFVIATVAAIGFHLVAYWILKVIAMDGAIGVSIILSALWEEWAIWKLSRKPAEEKAFFAPVLRANLYTMLVIMLYAAILMLPQRMKSNDFLVKDRRGARPSQDRIQFIATVARAADVSRPMRMP